MRQQRCFRVFIALMAAALCCSTSVKSEERAESLVGTHVDEFSLKDFRGRTHALSEYAESKFVVLAFLGTECPLAKLYGPRLASIDQRYRDKGVTILGVNSNRHDSITEVAAYARLHKIEFPVIKDLGNRVADRIGATRTPEVIVLDEKRDVRYHGRIDDQYGVGYIRDEPERSYLTDALDDLLASRKLKTPSTEVVGCFIGKVREPKPDSKVTYSNQVARVLQKHCVECHRSGEIAPFSLTSYDDVVGWGETMVEVIDDRRMPPWHANPEFGSFRNARNMSVEEKKIIHDWVAAGCPEGDPSEVPEPRQFISGWQLPREPDLVVEMRERPYDVQAEGTVKYQYFRVDPELKEDTWVLAAEAQPGNRAVVHHILVFVRPPKGQRKGLGSAIGEFFAAYVPGYRTPIFPEGMAKFVPAGSEFVFQVHYTPIGTPQKDLSRVGLVFADPKKIDHVIMTRQASNPRGIKIPPHDENFRVEANSARASSEVQLLGFMPHMHLRGKSFRYEAKFADGRSEVLLDVPRYDFNWQTAYRVTKPISMPKGSYLHCVAHFDNSEDNLNNPDPTQTVRWGDQTWNEMMIGYFDVAVPLSVFGAESGSNTKRSVKRPATPNDEFKIGNRTVKPTAILALIGRLDRNKNGKIEKQEVPAKYVPIFKELDANSDDVLTVAEARDAIEKLRKLQQ